MYGVCVCVWVHAHARNACQRVHGLLDQLRRQFTQYSPDPQSRESFLQERASLAQDAVFPACRVPRHGKHGKRVRVSVLRPFSFVGIIGTASKYLHESNPKS